MTSASQTGTSLSFTYDALGRRLTQTGASGSYTSQYDLAGRRTRLTHPDNFYVDHDYLVTGETVAIRENGATSGVGVLATFGYDQQGRRSSLTFGNGESASYQYDAVSRLSQLARDLGGTTNDLTLTFAYNPASQIVSTTRSNDLYAWTGHGSGTTSSTADGLNRLASHGGITPTYDARGNLTSDGTRTYAYDSENKLTSLPSLAVHYDPIGRLNGVGSPVSVATESDGPVQVAERVPGSAVSFRHVFGPGTDEPLVAYVGSGTTDRRFLHADERGSIVAVTNSSAGLLAINRYDEYGRPETTSTANMGRFLYTGQRYYSSPGIYYYKARFYDPRLGRFLQTDPIGFKGGMNLYGYVGGDPVNFGDPSGLVCKNFAGQSVEPPTGSRICGGHGAASVYGGIAGSASGSTTAGPGGAGGPTFGEAYAAAKDLVGHLGSGAVNAAADYFMGRGSFQNAALQAVGNQCRGRYNCDDIPTERFGLEIAALLSNDTFARAFEYVVVRAKETGNEWGFTGVGRANFRLIGGFLQGSRDAISAEAVAQRAKMGADLFFHIHPNIGGRHRPWLSAGFSGLFTGGDLGVAYNNNMVVGAFAFSNNEFYWFDARGMKR